MRSLASPTSRRAGLPNYCRGIGRNRTGKRPPDPWPPPRRGARRRLTAIPGELPEQVFPDATPRPAHKAIIDGRWRTIGFRAIAPAATALEHMHDTADDAPVVHSLDATHIRRQLRLNPRPLLITQPEQLPAHQSFPQYESSSYCRSRWINEF